MAEGEGFEPSRRFPVYTLSRRAPSTTRPPLRRAKSGGQPDPCARNPDQCRLASRHFLPLQKAGRIERGGAATGRRLFCTGSGNPSSKIVAGPTLAAIDAGFGQR